MIYSEDSNSDKVFSLPNQRISRKKKTKKWYQDTIDYYINNKYNESRVRKSHEEIQDNWNFYNSLLDESEVKLHLDPLNVDEGLLNEEANTFGFFDILHQPFSTLIGEELKRQYELKAYAINEEVINQKDREFKDTVSKWMMKMAKKDSINKEEVKKKLDEFEQFRRHDLQTAHERMANQLISVFKRDSRIKAKYKFNKAFENLQITNEEIIRIYHVGDEVNFKPVNSKNFTVFGLGESGWVQDGYAWMEEEYVSINDIINEFAEELTDSQIKKLYESSSQFGEEINPSRATFLNPELIKNEEGAFDNKNLSKTFKDTDGAIPLDLNDRDADVNEEGDIKVYRVQWKALRKIGKLKYYDEFGDAQYDWVDEEYPVNEENGEEVEYIWVNELYEGVKILDFYLKYRVSPIQMRSIVNPSLVKSSYVGYINVNDGNTKTLSRLDRLKDYQRMYNIYVNKLISLWTQNLGKVAFIDAARIPSSMESDEWYLWLKKFKIAWENSFEEANKGAAKGMLAGNSQQNARVADMSLTDEINNAINMLAWIESRVNKIAAVPEPRQGDLEGDEGLGVSQQAIIQSSHQTHKDFFIHDMIIASTYELMVEYAKYLWKDNKVKRQYVLDDLSNQIIDIDGGLLASIEVGVTITNSSQLFEMYNTIRQLTHAAMQNGTINLSDVAKMYLAESPSEMLHLLEESEDKRLEQQSQAQERQAQLEEKKMQMEAKGKQDDHQRKLEEMDRQFQYDMKLEELKLESKLESHARDNNHNQIEDEVELEKERIKAKADKEELEKKLELEEKLKNKELALKEKELKIKSKEKRK